MMARGRSDVLDYSELAQAACAPGLG